MALVSILQTEPTGERERERETDFNKLVHMIIEVKVRNLQSRLASWGHREEPQSESSSVQVSLKYQGLPLIA